MSNVVPRQRGFTLLEMILATGLLVMLMGMMFWFYAASLNDRRRGREIARQAQLARVILQRIADEVRQATGHVTDYGSGVIGFEDRVSVNTIVLPDDAVLRERKVRHARVAAQFDLSEVSYYIAWDEEHPDENGDPRALGLVRKAVRTFNQPLVVAGQEGDEAEEARTVKEELYAPEIKYLSLRYFDGATWTEKWQVTQGNSLPQMIRITVGFVPEIPDDMEFDPVDDDFLRPAEEQQPLASDRYSTIVRLTNADRFFGSRLTREASSFAESEGL